MSALVIGTGAALPPRVVGNAELAALLGVEPAWIEERCGVRERRYVEAEGSASQLAIAAGQAALADAGLAPGEIDAIVAATLSPDFQVPGIAPLVQAGLGCRRVPAFDVRAACAGILHALQVARGLIASGAARHVLCVGAEAQSKGLDLHPRSAEISMLFGDGAGACVVSGEAGRGSGLAIEDVLIETDGTGAGDLGLRGPGSACGARWQAGDVDRPVMDGRRVILVAVRSLADSIATLLARHGLRPADVDVLVPHQANLNLLHTLAGRLGVARERVVVTLREQGNTSGASAFLALDAARRGGRLRPGCRVVIAAFGAGFTWGAALARVVGD